MRWLACTLLLSFSAHAASVLLVPQDAKARDLADELSPALAAAKITVKMAGPTSPAVVCLLDKAKRDTCLATIAEKAKVAGIFVIGGGFKGNRGNLSVELFANGATVKRATAAVTKGRVATQAKGLVASLLKLLPKGDPAPAPKPVVTEKEPEIEPVTPQPSTVTPDAPTRTEPMVLSPTPREPVVDLQTPVTPAPKPKVAAWIFTGLAIAAAGTAGAMGGLGLAGKTRLETAPDGVSDLTYQQATALQKDTNMQFTVALGAGIGAGVTGVVAAILWGVE